MASFTCPVCGYPDLRVPAWDEDLPSFSICPCCDCEFGYHDARPEARLRYQRSWLAKGAPWFRAELRPPDWDLRRQLASIGVDLADYDCGTAEATDVCRLPEDTWERLRRAAWVAEARAKAFRFALESNGDPQRIEERIEGREEIKNSRTIDSPNAPMTPDARLNVMEDAYIGALREALAIVSDAPTSA